VPSCSRELAVAADAAHGPRVHGLTRAELLRCGVAVALGAGLPTSAAAPASAAAGRGARALTRSRFAPYVGSAFFIRRPQGGHERVELVEIGDLPGVRDSELAFSLVFHGRRRGAVGQGTVTFSHEALGTLELFQVPVGAAQAGQDYQVIVDRRRCQALVRSPTHRN
jgi:hypothetical protein